MISTEKALKILDEASSPKQLSIAWDRITSAPTGYGDWRTDGPQIREHHCRRRLTLRIQRALEIFSMHGLDVHWSDIHAALDAEQLAVDVNPADQLSPNDPVVDGVFGPNALRIVSTKIN